jgi:hypothetical protein
MKVGDKIRVTFEATYAGRSRRPGNLFLVDFECEEGYSLKYTVPSSATVEVIEPADDPSKDPIGTVRENTGALGGVYVKNSEGWRHLELGFEPVPGSDTLGPLVGVVPGSPAARVKENG